MFQSNKQYLNCLEDIDLTLMKQLLQKSNTSIFDSILFLLKRVFQQKRELYQNLQKIILVKGGLAEQIAQNIPRYRQQFEILKDTYFLSELNRPIEQKHVIPIKQDLLNLDGLIKFKSSFSKYDSSDKRDICTSESVYTDKNTIDIHKNQLQLSSSNLKIQLIVNSELDQSQNFNKIHNIDVDWKNIGLGDQNHNHTLDFPQITHQNSEYLSVPTETKRKISNLSEDKNNLSGSFSIDKDVSKMIKKQIMLHDDQNSPTPQSVSYGQEEGLNIQKQIFFRDIHTTPTKEQDESDSRKISIQIPNFKKIETNSQIDANKEDKSDQEDLKTPQDLKDRADETANEILQEGDQTGNRRQRVEPDFMIQNFDLQKGEDTTSSRAVGGELANSSFYKDLIQEKLHTQELHTFPSYELSSVPDVQSIQYVHKDEIINFFNNNNSNNNNQQDSLLQSQQLNDKNFYEIQEGTAMDEMNQQQKERMRIQLESQRDHSDLSPINKKNEDVEDSPMSYYYDPNQTMNSSSRFSVQPKKKSNFYTPENVNIDKKKPISLAQQTILEQSDISEITNMVTSKQNSIQSPLKYSESKNQNENSQKINILEVHSSDVDSDNQRDILKEQIKLRSIANFEYLITDLVQLTQFMKQQAKSKDQQVEESQLLTDDIIKNVKFENELKNFLNERELNNLLIQNLIRSHDLHQTLFQFLNQVDQKNLSFKQSILIQQIYEFLTVMIWNNHEAKMELLKSKNIAINHINLNLGALELLKELYTNVKPLLLNQSEIIRVTSAVLKVVNQIPSNKLYQSKLIHFLKSLIILNDNPIKINQGIIYQEIQNKQYNYLQIFDIEYQEELLNNMPLYINDFEKQFDSCVQTQKITIHSFIMYMMAIFSLFSMLVEGSNEVNLKKSRKLHPYKFLIQIMEKCSICIPLKKEVRGYINRVYYNHSNLNKKKSHTIRSSINKSLNLSSSLNPFDENNSLLQSSKIVNPNSSLQSKNSTSSLITPKAKVRTSLIEATSQNKKLNSNILETSIMSSTTASTLGVQHYNNDTPNSSNRNIPTSNLSIIPEDQEHTINEKRLSDCYENFQNTLRSQEQSESSTPHNKLPRLLAETSEIDSPIDLSKGTNLSLLNNPSTQQEEYEQLEDAHNKSKQKQEGESSKTSESDLNNGKPSSYQQLSSENLKSLQDMATLPDQVDEDDENELQNGLEQVKEDYENEEEVSQITLEKRQKVIQNNRYNFKREIQSNFFNELHVKESELVQSKKKSIFLKDGMLLDVIKDLNFISNDLNEYVYILQNNSSFENVEIENYLRFKYYKSYAALNFKENIYSLYFLFGNKNFVDLLKIQLDFILKQKDKQENPHGTLINIVNSLIQILKLNNYLNQPIRYIVKKLYLLIKSFDFKALSQKEQYLNLKFSESVMFPSPYRSAEGESLIMSSINNTTLINASMSFTQEIKGTCFDGKRDSFQVHKDGQQADEKQLLKSIKTFVRLYDQSGQENKTQFSAALNKKSPLIISEDMNEQLNNQLKFELYVLDNSKQFKDYLKTESDKLFQMQWKEESKGENIPTEVDDGESISKKSFIQSILETAISNQHLPDDLHIFYLNILIRMIKDLNPKPENLIQEIDVWETSFWKDNKDSIERMQTLIYNQGGAKLICSLLKQPNLEQRLNLVSHILLFGISLLLGGHRKTQNRILYILKEDLENIILININTLIQKIGKIVYRFSKEQIRVKAANQLNLSDTHDYYDSTTQIMVRKNTTNPDDYKEDQFKGLCIEVLKRIFRFLQLCCENNNIDMKNYLRSQTYTDKRQKTNSINFIVIAAEINREFLKIMNKNIIQIPNFISDFLIEVTQVPCLQNQISLCQTSYYEDVSLLSQIIDTMKNKFYQKKSEEKNKRVISFNSEEDDINLLDFYSKTIQSALVVLEGTDTQIYEEVMSKISIEFLQIVVNQRLKIMKVDQLSQLKSYIFQYEVNGYYDKHIVEIMQVLTIIRRCSEYDSEVKERFYTNIPQQREILEFLNSRIATIEIYDQKKCKQVYFPLVPIYSFLSDITKEKIMKSVNRETQRDKIIDLLNYKNLVFDEMLHNYQLSKYKIPATGDNVQLIQTIITYFSLFLNVYLPMSTMVQFDKENGMALHFHQVETKNNIRFLIFLFFILVITFIVFTAINQVAPKTNFKETILNRFFLLCKNDQIPYLSILMLSSILSLIIHPKFIVLSLPYSFSKLKFVQGVIENLYQALFMQRKQLVLVSFLGVLFLYIFSVLSFNNYYEEVYGQDEIESDEKTCNSLLSCMITLTLSGVVGNSMTHWEFSTFISDTLYFIFMSILFTNIISGIMTDTFAEMRDKRNFIETDKKNRCYICGIERTTLEKKESTFEEHIKMHNLWEYLYYIYNLMIKEETEYTGIEYMIKDKLLKDDITWIPNNISQND